MSTQAQYAATPKVGMGLVSVGDASRTNPTNVTTLFTAGTSGSRIDRINIEGVGPVTASQLRLWLYDGSNYRLWQEVPVTANTPSSSTSAFNSTLSSSANSSILPLVLPTGYSLRASINDTQYAQSSVAVYNNTVNSTLDLAPSSSSGGATATAAVTVVSNQTTAGAGYLTIANGTLSQYGQLIQVLGGGNVSTVSFTVLGLDVNGNVQTEVIAGPAANNQYTYSTKFYTTIFSVYANGSTSGNVVGVYACPVTVFGAPVKFNISSAANLVGTNITIQGIKSDGTQVTEVIAGPSAGGSVTTVNTFKYLMGAQSSTASVAFAIRTIPALGGVAVEVVGGDF